MGAVYRATDTQLGRSVDVKISRSLFEARFQEARRPSTYESSPYLALHDDDYGPW